jgi:hypothetical protein
MFDTLLKICTSSTALFWVVVVCDLSIAAAYFAIPITMAVVMRHRREDIVYPWLWGLFVAFIMACGLTHLTHVWSATVQADNLVLLAIVELACAATSVATAIAFGLILPEIKLLPSPKRQRELLEAAVAERTKEKDLLIREINHRIGNQLQILQSVVSIEMRGTEADETSQVLQRIRAHLEQMSQEHRDRSAKNYLTDTASGGEMSSLTERLASSAAG